MIRVVLDTNIIVSALLQPLGPPAQVFLLGISGSIQMCVTANVFAEYEEVIRRPKFNRAEAEIDGALQSIRERSVWVRPTEMIRACSDPRDDMFLECANAAGAAYMVTGNSKHFPETWRGIRVVTCVQLLEVVSTGAPGGPVN